MDAPTYQYPLPPRPPQDGTSYVQTPVGIFKLITIILGTIAVGLACTDHLHNKIIFYTKRTPLVQPEFELVTKPAIESITELAPEPDYNDWNRRNNRDPYRHGRFGNFSPVIVIEQSEFLPCSSIELERFFLSVTVIALLVSLSSLCIYALSDVESTCPDATFHIMAGLFVGIAGILYTAYGFSNILSENCKCPGNTECKNAYQIFAGVVALLNGAIYWYMACFCMCMGMGSSVPITLQARRRTAPMAYDDSMHGHPSPEWDENNRPYPGTTESQKRWSFPETGTNYIIPARRSDPDEIEDGWVMNMDPNRRKTGVRLSNSDSDASTLERLLRE